MQRSFVLAYAAFALVCVLLFGFIKFPYDALKAWLADSLARATATQVTIHSLGPSFLPPGLKITGLELTTRDAARRPLLKLPKAVIWPALLSLLQGRMGASLAGEVYGGQVKATATSGSAFDTSQVVTTLELDRLKLEAIPDLAQQLLLQSLTGELSGSLDLTAPADGKAPPKAAGRLRLTGVMAGSIMPFIKDQKLDVGQIDGLLNLESNVLKASEIKFKSKSLEGEVAGTVNLAGPAPVLDLSGTWRLEPAALDMAKLPNEQLRDLLRQRKPLPLRITGQPGGNLQATFF